MGDRLGIHGAVDIFFLIPNILGLKKWLPDCSLAWVALGQQWSLSKTTKLILLDSLLQEVCIYSGMTDCSVVRVSHNPVLFRTDESPLNNLSQPKIELLVFSLVSVWLSSGHFKLQFSPPGDKTNRRVLQVTISISSNRGLQKLPQLVIFQTNRAGYWV